MEDVIQDVQRWRKEQQSVALATVIETWGSAPRQAGAKMAMAPDNKISGSVSGGCIEGAVYETGMAVLESAQPQLLHFGVADETAWEVGLACGGSIDVFVEPLDTAIADRLNEMLDDGLAYALATIIKGPDNLLGRKLLLSDEGEPVGTLGDLDEQALPAAREALEAGKSRRQEIGDVEIFIEVHRPRPTLIMVGGVHIAVALTSIAKTLGYNTVVVDPRRAFGSQERFPHVDRLIQAWPEKAFAQLKLTPDSAVAMLTHDPKIDDPALKIVLESKAFYVGALGSSRTQAKRRKRLLEAGLTEAQLDRIHGPIGLDLGGRTPPEIALAVMAEIVKARHSA